MNDKSLWKSKTIWTAIIAIITALSTYLAGEIGLAAFIQIAVTALIGAFLRTSVSGVLAKVKDVVGDTASAKTTSAGAASKGA